MRRHADLKIAEGELHKAVADLLDAVLLPPAVWTTFPAGWGKLNKSTAGRLKGSGLKAGMPDILVFYNGSTIGIELKTLEGALSRDQKLIFPLLEKAGMKICVCRAADEVLEYLRMYGLPLRKMRVAA